MKISELISRLQEIQSRSNVGDIEVMVLDSGVPRDINLGPVLKQVTEEHAEVSADCEEREGELIAAIGFGCY